MQFKFFVSLFLATTVIAVPIARADGVELGSLAETLGDITGSVTKTLNEASSSVTGSGNGNGNGNAAGNGKLYDVSRNSRLNVSQAREAGMATVLDPTIPLAMVRSASIKTR